MIIGLDLSKAVNEKAGIARYTYNLAENLLKLDKKNQYRFFYTFLRKREEKKEIIINLTKKAKNVRNFIYPLPGYLKEWLLPLPLFSAKSFLGQIDVYHAPDFLSIFGGNSLPQIVTIHDLTMFLFPEHRGEKIAQKLAKKTKEALLKSQMVIATSQNTKKDLINILKVPEEKIKVIYGGTASHFRPRPKKEIEKVKKKYHLPSNYLLFLGTLEPRKNLIRLLLAYQDLDKKLREKYKLVLSGGVGWQAEKILKTISKPSLKKDVFWTDYLDEADLPALYSGATLFLFPSLYEGFGLPPLEAMACGTPVISSNTSSLPEIIGEAGILINPKKVKEISQAISKVLSSPSLKKNLKEKGLLQAKKFSWRACAQETLEIYQKLGEK